MADDKLQIHNLLSLGLGISAPHEEPQHHRKTDLATRLEEKFVPRFDIHPNQDGSLGIPIDQLEGVRGMMLVPMKSLYVGMEQSRAYVLYVI